MSSEYVDANEAARLRQARNTVRHYAERIAQAERLGSGKQAIHRARYERAITLLVAHKLSGKKVRHDKQSLPKPYEFSL